ncbi:NAD(P)-dependent oxidoreductase [Nocardia sp. NPDC047038]|uniref:NAD(P)-dependent oxidoreductase n=1 Tax=Nocardia sp. NPDC047038 TaxID=3154338 RepID=UPI0033C439A9
MTDRQRLREFPATAQASAAIVIGNVHIDRQDFEAMRHLAVVATTPQPLAHIEELWARGIPVIDGVRGWSQARAELALALILTSLRQLAFWQKTAVTTHPAILFRSVDRGADSKLFVSGVLRDKNVCVIGGGFTGYKIAELCAAFGAYVWVVDPNAKSTELAEELGAEIIDVDEVPLTADIMVVAEPNHPAHRPFVTADTVDALRNGTLVVTVTSTLGIDITALRKRVCRDELMWATDVLEFERIIDHDPILQRHNVIALPSIGRRTRDADHELADAMIESVMLVLDGGSPLAWDLITPGTPLPRVDSPSGTHLLIASAVSEEVDSGLLNDRY